MKKIWILTTLLVGSLLLTGCNSNCNCDVPQCENWEDQRNEAKEFCLSKWWTHLWATSPIEEHWECMFPSWIGCRDDMILDWKCNWEPDLSNIDAAEERQIWCENNVDWWMQDMMEWAVYYGIEWDGDEEEIKDEEWNLVMITRNFYAKYDKDWQHWKLPWRCEANFVDGSNWTTYGEEFLVENEDYNQFLEDIKSSWEQPQGKNDYHEEVVE